MFFQRFAKHFVAVLYLESALLQCFLAAVSTFSFTSTLPFVHLACLKLLICTWVKNVRPSRDILLHNLVIVNRLPVWMFNSLTQEPEGFLKKGRVCLTKGHLVSGTTASPRVFLRKSIGSKALSQNFQFCYRLFI